MERTYTQTRKMYQITFAMGVGATGKAIEDMLVAQAKRFNCSKTHVLKIALRTLAQTEKIAALETYEKLAAKEEKK